jgi:hypothetical protein
MTAGELISVYEQSFSQKPIIFGQPEGAFSPEEDAGNLIKHHGLHHAREIARAKADEFPAAWDHWTRVAEILNHTQ